MTKFTRRHFLALCGAAVTTGGCRLTAQPSQSQVSVVRFDRSGNRQGLVKVDKVVLSDNEWKRRLNPQEYGIAREADTEVPYTGKNWNNHARGLYRCVCCDNALFTSDTKFESGTGWPSFWKPVANENIETVVDAHLGHVFDDGPEPTGLRYCMNGNVLKFQKL